MINQIIKDWVGEVDVPYFEPEDPLESGRIQGRNNHIVLLHSRIPQLTERIEKEILGEQTITSLFLGKKIIKSKMLPKDEIWVGEGPTRYEMLKNHQHPQRG